MSIFDKSVDFVLKNEGGLSENINDSGGTTNFGISVRFLREVKEEHLKQYGIFTAVTEETIRELTIDQAKLIYRGEFWDSNELEEINSQFVCSYIFDMMINHGESIAIKMVQRAAMAVTFDQHILREDGIMGRETIGFINSCGDEILLSLVAIRGEFYRNLAVNPKNEMFLKGWLARCYSVFN